MSKEPKTEPKVEPKVEPQTEPSATGLPYPDQPATPEEMVRALDFPSINEPPGPRVPVPTMHTLESLNPDTAAIGDDDVTMHVIGTGFTAAAQIVFNGGAETTVFVSDTELTTTVKPSTAEVAGAFPVTVVQNGFTVEPPLDFTFIEEPVSRGKRKRY
jgi:hypothetical protein